jgi:hypothetical protein
MGTSHYPPNFTTTPNFPPGHLQSPSHFFITSIFTPGHLPLPTQFHRHSQFYTQAHQITHPLSPPLQIAHMSTSDHLPTFPITSSFTLQNLPLATKCCHHSQCHPWAHAITHPLSSPLPISHMGTFNHPPPFTNHFQFRT